ncbi:MAG: sulfurtransferase TusA family protein [Calditrichia bacterium]
MENKLKEIPTYDHFLDTSGSFCPVPVTRTQAKMAQMNSGEVLCVAATDPISKIDLPAWCHSHKQEYLGYRIENNVIYNYLKRTKHAIRDL